MAGAFATTAVTTATAGTFAAAGGTSLAAGTFAGVGAASAAGGAGLLGAGATGVGLGTVGAASTIGGTGFLSGASSFLSGLSFLDTLSGISTIDSIISPLISGSQANDIARINAQQTDFDARQKQLQGREESLKALETLNQQTARNITAGFASGIGLSPSVASSIDAVTRKTKFEDTLSRASTGLEAEAIKRKASLQRAQGKTAIKSGVFESLKAAGGTDTVRNAAKTLFS